MEEGDIKYLRTPYKGYRAVELIECSGFVWVVCI